MKYMTTAAVAATLLFSGYAAAQETAAVVNGGKIIAYRPGSIGGFASGCPIRIEGEQIAELGRGKFVELEVASGRHTLTNKSSSVEVTVDPGETRYVRCKIKMGFWLPSAELQIVDKASFDEEVDHLERKAAED